MLDLGLDKLALIGAVALIVIGPEKLPKVARTVGHMLGKAVKQAGNTPPPRIAAFFSRSD